MSSHPPMQSPSSVLTNKNSNTVRQAVSFCSVHPSSWLGCLSVATSSRSPSLSPQLQPLPDCTQLHPDTAFLQTYCQRASKGLHPCLIKNSQFLQGQSSSPPTSNRCGHGDTVFVPLCWHLNCPWPFPRNDRHLWVLTMSCLCWSGLADTFI